MLPVACFLVVFQLRLFLCSDFDELQFNASPEEFTSKKITTKILQQIEVSSVFMNTSCPEDGRQSSRFQISGVVASSVQLVDLTRLCVSGASGSGQRSSARLV